MSVLFVICLWATAGAAISRVLRLRLDESFLGAGVLICAEAVASCLLLGWLGILSVASVRSAAALLAIAHLIWMSSPGKTRPFRRGRLARIVRRQAILLPAGAAFLVVVACRLLLAVSLPVESWDGLSYHAPIVWRWVQQGGFDLAGWSGPQRWFAMNGEILSLWLVELGGGGMGAVKTAQTLGLPLLGAAGAVLARRLAGPFWSAPVALALMSLPIALIHAGLPYVDLIHAAFWVASAAFAVCWDRTGRPAHLLLGAVSFGLALGTKTTLYFMAPLALPLLLAAGDCERRRMLLRWAAAALAIIAATGMFTYMRNWWLQGSPVFPYAFRLAGHQVFAGPLEPGELLVSVERWFVSSRAGWLTYPFRETMRGVVGYSSENGFGPIFAAGWALLPLAFWRAARTRDRAALGFLLLLPAVAFFFLAMHPTREPRYVIFLAAVPVVGAAMAMRDLRGRLRAAALAFWSAGIVFGLLGTASYFTTDFGLSRAWQRVRRGEALDALDYYRWQYGSLAEAWAFLDARLLPGEVVAVNYGELLLPWAGVPPRAKVFSVGSRPDDLPQTLWAEDSRGWTEMLERLGVRYVAVWSPAWYPNVGQVERGMIARQGSRFCKLGRWDSPGFGLVELFELEPDADKTL